MTPDELEAMLCDSSIPIEELRVRVRELHGVNAMVAAGLQSALEARDWDKFENYLFATFEHPDPAYVPAIAAALALKAPEVPNEDALDVLADIGDPGPLDLLTEIAFTEYDWDEFHQIGVKAVWAIAAIHTPEADAVLADIAERGHENPRAWAERELSRRQPPV